MSGIDLAVRPGELVGILGPNGAGKTTAISIMLRLGRPSQGTIRVFGASPEDPAVRGRIGAMLQKSGVPKTLTVAEVVRLIGAYDQPAGTLTRIAIPPLGSGVAADSRGARRRGHRPAISDALNQDQPAAWGEAGVSTWHEGLSCDCGFDTNSRRIRALTPSTT